LGLRSSYSQAFALLFVLGACSEPPPKPVPKAEPPENATMSDPANPIDARPDPHSFSRPDQVRVTHMGLSWDVEFDQSRLTGFARALVDRKDPKAPLILDTRDLAIRRVSTAKSTLPDEGVPRLVPAQLHWTETKFEMGPGDEILGAALIIGLPEGHDAVQIEYSSTPAASGLQWLAAEQTAGKQKPFLYSQSQAIHARSWIPCQDSPGIRITYDARVGVPEGFTAVMAAEQVGDPGQTTARFVMPQRIPPYLLAIGVGDLAFKSLGARTGVWADPAQLEASAYELVDMEKMLETAEGLYGEYQWGRYDVLMLPPAFPFGGMENPRLTFATPTILAGDRSLVSLIAHELAHSWSGNLVTNATWADLWLNEGFTVYFERRIVEALYGEERAQMEAALGRQDLERELADDLQDRPEDQRLHLDLRGRDPDDVFSSVAYEKGSLFLVRLEQSYGRERFDGFLRTWFEENAFDTATTAEFISVLKRELLDADPPAHKPAPDLDIWLEGTGLPPDAPDPSAAPLDRVDAQMKAWNDGTLETTKLAFGDWTTHERLHFLRALPADVGTDRLAELDGAFSITKTGNSEVLDEWLCIAARRRYEPAFARMESFLIEVGRRKFLTPLYKALSETEAGKAQANAIYGKARPGYHAISRGTLDDLLAWEG
jgi:aminopeptidase N